MSAATKGVLWLLGEAKATSAGWVAVPQISNMETIAKYQGLAPLARLTEKPYEGQVNGLSLSLITKKKMPYNYSSHPVLVVFPPTKYLDDLHGIPGATKMLVVPWNRKEIEQWKQYSNATSYLGEAQSKPVPTSNPVLTAALRTLSALVNKSTGVLHPLDKDKAIAAFEILKANNEPFTPEEVKVILISEFKWKPEYAQDAADVAKGVLAGKRLKKTSRGQMFRDSAIDEWRQGN